MGVDGIALTHTNALARTVVREAAERWPHWWSAELFGPPHREADLAVLGALHDGLRRLRLVRRRARTLYTTGRGKELLDDPAALLNVLIADLGAGDPFTETVAAAAIDTLAAGAQCDHDGLVATALSRARRGGWRDPDGLAPTDRTVSWVVSAVLCRGEAYGVIARRPDPTQSRFGRGSIALSDAGRLALGLDQAGSAGMAVLVFDAELLNTRGVRARLAVRADQHLTALHDAIQEAFGWYDDHLYSFWLDGTFWG
ncbi:MAG: plasmid pRiA4b ORF-3 family protein, partial [Chloroflexota bacterium]|nr:plasmid pRiA4b ORF-3 family protein [Chloroflexota bacterium]